MRRLSATLRTDLFMLPLFVTVAVTGVGFHISGHKGVEAFINVWKTLHIGFSTAFAILTAIHIKQHRVWYNRSLAKSFNRRNTLTLLLTAVVVFEIISGYILLTDLTHGPICGHLHWVIGILLSILAIAHIAGRWKSLKFITRKQKQPLPQQEKRKDRKPKGLYAKGKSNQRG